VLSAEFVADRDRLARFEREARVLASLNHPHIGAIYGVEAIGAGRALILELVEGETLAERITKGSGLKAAGIPIADALAIAQQIAEALEAAHDRGIVHRDLKPANIKITPAGVVKVLDFGLAKAAAGGDLSHPPAFTLSGTREGVLLGTAAYMSPEQARGQAVDKRADIWAFGCVMYEVLTGRTAFPGRTISDHIAAILEREPDWTALPADLPAGIRRLLRRSLEKDSRRRLHDAADARIEIDEVLHAGPGVAVDAPVANQPPRRAGLPWAIAAIASLVAVVAVAALISTRRAAPRTQTAPPRVSRLTIGSSGAAAVALTGARSLAITPDGTRVVYVGNSDTQIFVRPIDRLDATAILTGVAPLNFVFVSPDGQWVGFEEGNTLKKIAITGGPPGTIAQIGVAAGATWAPDGTIVIGTGDPAAGLQRVSSDGGELTVLAQPASVRGERAYVWPELLPGGRAVLFTIIATTGGLDAAQVAVLDLATHTTRVLVRGGSHAHYVSTGPGTSTRPDHENSYLLYAAGGMLHAVPFDLAALETRGTATTVLPRLVTNSIGGSEYVVSVDGTLAYVEAPAAPAQTSTLVWVDRQGREEPLGAPARDYYQPRLSPDGTRVAVAVAGQGSISVWDVARRVLGPLTAGPAVEFSAVWTRDGRHLLFFSPARGAGLFWQRTTGIAAEQRLGEGLPTDVTPDGTRALFSAPGARDIMTLALDGTGRVEPLVQTSSDERNGVVSPDGHWLAYESNSSGRFEIYVGPYPNVNDGQRPISTAGGTRPLWTPTHELIYVSPDGALMGVRVDPRGGTWRAGSPEKILEGPYATLSSQSGRTYDISHDGKRFLLVKPAPTHAGAQQIVVVQNWFEELKAKVGGGQN
jgi:hypothetical protein